ncbi:MAG: hypothetical protein ACKOWF_01715 [Chloroflexota bacterium]
MTQTLHPFDEDTVAAWVRLLLADGGPDDAAVAALFPGGGAWAAGAAARSRQGVARAGRGSEEGANAVSFGLAQALAARYPAFVVPGASLTAWEARIDRGAGMLLRPPSRLFGEAGLPPAVARAMPIRLDPAMSMMGGAHVPARLVPRFREMLEEREARLLRRLAEAEMDAAPIYAAVLEAAAWAADRGLGLYEAVDVVVPGAPAALPPGANVILPDARRLPKETRRRLEAAARPPKPPGLLSRLLGRRREAGDQPR